MFEVGTKVVTLDGEETRLEHLVLDVNSHDVTDVVVSLAVRPDERYVVSTADVGHVDQQGMRLNVTSEQLRRRRRFSQDELVVPAAAGPSPAEGGRHLVWANPYQGPNPGVGAITRPMTRLQVSYGIGDRSSVVGRDTPVLTRGGGRVGTVDHLAVDPETYRPQAVIVRLPGIRRRRVMVPVDGVASWERSAIVLDLSRDELQALPPFTTHHGDPGIVKSVCDALRAAGVPVRALDVVCSDGHVTLRGYTVDADTRRQADGVARAVPGVLGLDNALTTDRILRTRVAARLDDDPIASLYPIDVAVSSGVVELDGAVPNEAIRAIVTEVVESTPGVGDVVERLEVRPQDFDTHVPAAPAPDSRARTTTPLGG